jgi:preprotein translocase subunit SecB
MVEERSLPLSGYAIVKIYMTSAELKLKQPTNPEVTEPVVNFGWDWRRGNTDKSVFEVRISLAMEPVKERPYYAAVDAVGRFRKIGQSSVLPVEQFAALQAVAILLPYARQHLTSLTVNTLPGAYYLPSLNVVELMKGFDISKTTAAKEASGVGNRNVTSLSDPIGVDRKRKAARTKQRRT